MEYAALIAVGLGIALAGGAVVLRVYGRAGWGERGKALGRWLWTHRKEIGWAAFGLVVAGVFSLAGYLVWLWPDQEVPLSIEPVERTRLVNEVRRTWVGVAGGAVALVALWLGWLRSKAALDTARAMRDGQLTERFTRAIDQLGATKETKDGHKPNIEVRIGGIYALEQIARDAPEKYHWQIMEVLCAYVRENHRFDEYPRDGEPPPDDKRRLDVQAAVEVIGRRDARNDGERSLDLSGTDLRGYHIPQARLGGAKLIGTHLARASLIESHLERAILGEAHLEGAVLLGAHLEGAVLPMVYLEGADLSLAHLEGTDLRGAHLEQAVLRRAHLDGADIRRAHLERADLRGAHLEGADLRRAHLEGADLRRAHLEGADPDTARLEGALRPENDIRGWRADVEGRLHRIPDVDDEKDEG